ncbi:uncharacterized protein LOC123429203 [Hordeum vulgare subsp. vulgare]|uniref:Predicted protein n=1 Tax=Hordeum vulgare subsp. vulgare TaxID=112509 RepID=F2ECS6_HORVV|nr:uncharacterized protein LOC123429203 [Hordeum vulgare subsp. vulgare]BAK05148.1 predicted protein [Hordeum vulgare subsp. vulgare]
MAARAQRRVDGSALAFCVLHDLLGAAAFLAAHPLHAAYALFFSRGLLALAAFFSPLLLSTALLLVVLLTAAPGPAGARCLGSTCGVAVAALCAGLRPDAGLGLVGQLCSFVLGPAGVGEIVFLGEVSHIGGGSCSLLEEKTLLHAYATQALEIELPLQSLSGEEICFWGNGEFYEEDGFNFKDEIQEKNVVSEDLMKPPGDSSSSCSEHCFPAPGEAFMPEMEEQEESINKVESVSLPERKGFSGDAVEEKRLECDPVPLSAMETKRPERVSKPHSSISQRIRQWESGNLKGVLDEVQGNPVQIICLDKDSFEETVQLETESCDQKQSEESDRKQLPEQELVDVKEELVRLNVAVKCSKDLLQAQEIASVGRAEEGLQEQRSKDLEAEEDAQPDGQEHQEDVQQPASEPEEEQEHQDGGESPLRSTSIARRVHTRTSSENLAGAGEGSPSKGKEWKRTLACKLYEERIQHKLCRDRAMAGACADDMDMLWEAYETGGSSSSSAVAGDTKLRGGGSKAAEGSVHGEEEEEEEEEDEDEGPVRQLCCLQALKFSTRKMNLGGGKPSLSKISRVLKRMTALSRVGSRRK